MDFWGYIRENGKVGARNHVAIIPTVVCAAEAAQAIAHAVPGCIFFGHHQGCCQLPPGLKPQCGRGAHCKSGLRGYGCSAALRRHRKERQAHGHGAHTGGRRCHRFHRPRHQQGPEAQRHDLRPAAGEGAALRHHHVHQVRRLRCHQRYGLQLRHRLCGRQDSGCRRHGHLRRDHRVYRSRWARIY